MSGGDPYGLDPWVDARGSRPRTSLLPTPRASREDPPTVLFLGPPVRVRRGPRIRFLLILTFFVAAATVFGARFWAVTESRIGPPAGYEEATTPLGTPPPAVGLTSTSYAFAATQPDGSGPVAWSPCRPIHYVVRAEGAPANGAELIATAIARVSAATGLQFVDDGATQEAPSTDRVAYEPDLYGKRWAPVLVAWSTPEETPELAGDVAGIGGSAPVTRDGLSVYVTGSVTIDAPAVEQVLAGPNGAAAAAGVITHEFGHVVGLDHVDDPTQLMNPRTTASVTDFQPGDRAGLAVLGAGSCAPGL